VDEGWQHAELELIPGAEISATEVENFMLWSFGYKASECELGPILREGRKVKACIREKRQSA